MRSPALALGWQIWRCNRLALIALLIFAIHLAVLVHVLPEGFRSPHNPAGVLLTFVVVVVVTGFVTSFVTSHGATGKEFLGFPALMLRLPVRTESLVGWPMLYGALFVSLAWLAWRWLILGPCGFAAPVVWPALLFAAAASWLQVGTMHTPKCRHRWLEIALALGCVTLGTGLLVERTTSGAGQQPFLIPWALDVPEAVLAVFFAALIPGAFVTGVADLARLRHGNTPSRKRILHLDMPQLSAWLWPRSSGPFSSASAAQFWLEWRLHGSTFPASWFAIHAVFLLGFVASVMLAGVFDPGPIKSEEVWGSLWWLILLLACVGGMLSATTCVFDLEKRHVPSFGAMSLLTAVRPVPTGALVVAKLQAITLSLLITWTLAVLEGAALYLAWGNQAELAAWIAHTFPGPGRIEDWAFLTIAGVGGLVLMWQQAVSSIFLGLTGRVGVFLGGLALQFAAICAAAFVMETIAVPADVWLGWLRRPPPWLLGLAGSALLLKGLAAAWAIRAIQGRRLLPTQTLPRLLGVWLLACLGLVAFLAVLLPAGFIPLPWIGCGVVLALPLARVAFAPLALAWDRHR